MTEKATTGYVYKPKGSVEEPFYTVAQAMRLTGLSSTKFRYEPNKRELDARGADLSERVWRIPRRALIEMGWLSSDAPMGAEPEEGQERESRSSVLRIKELYKKTETLMEQLSKRETELAVANATIAAKDAEIANLLRLLENR